MTSSARPVNWTEATTEATIADRYVGETAIANFMNDAIVARSTSFPLGPDGQDQQVDIAVFNASGLVGSVSPETPITFNDWYGVMPYADTLHSRLTSPARSSRRSSTATHSASCAQMS